MKFISKPQKFMMQQTMLLPLIAPAQNTKQQICRQMLAVETRQLKLRGELSGLRRGEARKFRLMRELFGLTGNAKIDLKEGAFSDSVPKETANM